MSDLKNEYKKFCSDISNESYIGKLIHSNRYDLDDTNSFDSRLTSSDARKYISYAYIISEDDTSFLNSNYKKEINDLLKRALVFCSEENDCEYIEAVLFYNSAVMFRGTKSQKANALNKLINLKSTYGPDSDKPLKVNAWASLNLILSNHFYKNEYYIDYISSLIEGIIRKDNSNQGCSIFINYTHDLYHKLKTNEEESRNLALSYSGVLPYMNSNNKKVFTETIISDVKSKKLSTLEGLHLLSALALSYNDKCRRRVYTIDEYEKDLNELFDSGLINNIDILEEYAEHGKYANDISYFKRKDFGLKSLEMIIDGKVTFDDVDGYFEEIVLRYPIQTYGGNTEIDEFFEAMSEILLSYSYPKNLYIGYLKFATKYTIGHPDNPLNVATTYNIRKNERFWENALKSGVDPYKVFSIASALYAHNKLTYEEYLKSVKSIKDVDFSKSKLNSNSDIEHITDVIRMELMKNPHNMDFEKKLTLLTVHDEVDNDGDVNNPKYDMMEKLFYEYKNNEVVTDVSPGELFQYMKKYSAVSHVKAPDFVDFLKESYSNGHITKEDVMDFVDNYIHLTDYKKDIETFFKEGDKKTNPATIPTTTPQKSSEDKKDYKKENKTEEGVSSKDSSTTQSSSSSSSNPQSADEKVNEEKFNKAYQIASGNSGNWHSKIINYRYDGYTVNGGKNVIVDIIGDYGWTNNNIQKIKYSGGALAKTNNIPYCLVTEYQQLYNASISNILTSIVGILEGGRQLKDNVVNIGSTAIESLIGTFGKMMTQLGSGSVGNGSGGGSLNGSLVTVNKDGGKTGNGEGTSGSAGTGANGANGANGSNGSGNSSGTKKARAGESGGQNQDSGGSSQTSQSSKPAQPSTTSGTESGNTSVVGKVSSAVSNSVGWIKSLFTDAMSKINLGQSPATNSTLLAPYRLMYIVNPTGKKYCFPMLDKHSSSFRAANKMDEADGGEGSRILGNKLFSTVANVGRTILGLAQDLQQIAPFFDKNYSGSGGGVKQYHIERSKYFSYPTDGEEIETNFILYNTVKKDIWKKHYRFILGFMLRNLPYKQDVVSYYPPLFYDVIVPGVKRCPFCYVESFDVSPLGITRTVRISKREIGLDGSGSNEYYSVNVPEAWMIKIKFKSLLGTSANQILSGLVDAPITTSIK